MTNPERIAVALERIAAALERLERKQATQGASNVYPTIPEPYVAPYRYNVYCSSTVAETGQ